MPWRRSCSVGLRNLRGIEEEVSRIKSGSLIYDHIEPIMKAESWGGQQFWQWPSSTQFDERRGPMPIALWDIRGRTKENSRNREERQVHH